MPTAYSAQAQRRAGKK